MTHSNVHKLFELSVYYDGLCPICTKEMDHYQQKVGSEKIRFVDIAHPDFDAKAEGLDPDGIHKRFHAKKANGEILDGVDAFIEIWKTMDIWKPMQFLASNAISRPFFDLGYVVFAKIRPLLRRNECATDYCQTREIG